jgi:hypothetical protein
MIADDNQTLILVLCIPFLQRWHDMLAVNAAKRPHFDDNHFATQISQAQWRINIQPDIVG